MLFFDSRYRFVPLLAFVTAACGSDPADSEQGGATGSSSQSCDPTLLECPFGSYCKASDTCGEGACVEGPPGCNGHCDGVCGCDGFYYCNACEAHRTGVDVDVDGLQLCSEPPPAYTATSYGVDRNRLVLTKYDPARDRCIKITLDKGEEEGLPFELGVVEPWKLRELIATDQALDCKVSNNGCNLPGLQGQVADAVNATGSIFIEELPGTLPPNVGADLALTLDQPWLEEEESFVLDGMDQAFGPCQ